MVSTVCKIYLAYWTGVRFSPPPPLYRRFNMNIEKLTQKLSVHDKELKIPTKHMPAVLDILAYMTNQTKKRSKK